MSSSGAGIWPWSRSGLGTVPTEFCLKSPASMKRRFDGGTGLADSVRRLVHQRSSQLLSSTPHGLLINTRDLHQQPIGPPTHALRLKSQVPATLTFVQSTQEQVHLIMPLSLRMGFTSVAWTTLAGMNRLGWHPSVFTILFDGRTLRHQPT